VESPLTQVDRSDMPTQFLSFLDKVQRCIDFEAKEAPKWIQVYGPKGMMVVVPADDWLKHSSAADQGLEFVFGSLTLLAANQNVKAIAYMFPAMFVELDEEDDEILEELHHNEEQLMEHIRNSNLHPEPALFGVFETRDTFYQASARCDIPTEDSWNTAQLGDWKMRMATQKDMAAYKPDGAMSTIFNRASAFNDVLQRWMKGGEQ